MLLIEERTKRRINMDTLLLELLGILFLGLTGVIAAIAVILEEFKSIIRVFRTKSQVAKVVRRTK